MVTALYRRYRPETFAELIGQSQVTEPLMTALRTNRVNHAYLFSGPRGCGKTTSARILARCLNCVEGPTDTPCGKCPSCVELSRDGGGSLDVVEIDAASHNGVDDARDLRERAVFAPARDRYKIFILDEAHMVTPQGFNALLKIVEEPPEHIKFIFATTEPEKVIGTIRSRTHHYPFRLVPPAQMLEYVQQLCESEKVTVAPGVLPLVVRAGGGSVRDTLSLLDQLIAGSDGDSIEYERAVALLGYTHAALLGEVIDAIGARDAAAAFSAVDRVIQTGQDPRRFVEDLLERLRDLIVVAATGGGAAAVLRGIQQDELDQMVAQASRFGEAELSRAADVVAGALTEMTGATSPRLHLELMIARVLVPASDASARGTLARVERLERRVGVEEAGEAPTASRGSSEAVPAEEVPVPEIAEGRHEGGIEETSAAAPDKAVTFQQLSDAWAEILEIVGKKKRAAWAVAFTAKPMGLKEDVLALAFPSQNDVENFKKPQAADQSVSEILRQAIIEVLGLRVKFIARADAAAANAADVEADAPPTEPGPDHPAEVAPEPRPAVDAEGWAVAPIPTEEPASSPAAPESRHARPKKAPVEPVSSPVEPVETAAPAPAAKPKPESKIPSGGKQRYGEAVVREILGANFIEEQAIAPRVTPTSEA
ncbi:DNA polymerase-3 subunit gamma/tau [Cryobacterium mesophilum]|uniref:DNA polymerase III subunit gamma/tau n=1 Tax=Terrimesophilobacter mesophilus TaxID=433647 RepID=A0A4R8VDL4_9MICO|nr:DNA polymerase III subunit gamma and tau [Terrimesophilobacter mesophilus]MBB5633526.1 DNA polymerase-3 subunit gamma/tau [Terrimesophilobacter mesophilus]TFB80232.1 DNA polymerase III subunit gamma and tau [Terrimesophilobacter mesophilus]